jgi:copper oxidase (laccase) domain-containing protein
LTFRAPRFIPGPQKPTTPFLRLRRSPTWNACASLADISDEPRTYHLGSRIDPTHHSPMQHVPVMKFPALAALPDFGHFFTLRHPEIDVAVDRTKALERLEAWHDGLLQEELQIDAKRLATAEQVHGAEVALVQEANGGCVAVADGLICAKAGVPLGIYVADCCAVYLADPVSGAFGLLHSGRKGSELGITEHAVAAMREHFGVKPENLVVQLSPCIRPPDYEVDFAAEIRAQARRAGVKPENVHDQGISTASDLKKFYSYRVEKGKTGRMLAVLMKR